MEKLVFGNDGKTCAAIIRSENCTTTRPVVKLYPLEVSETVSDDTISSQKSTKDPHETETLRISSYLPENTSNQPDSICPQQKATKCAREKVL